jgi:hypothetical protein
MEGTEPTRESLDGGIPEDNFIGWARDFIFDKDYLEVRDYVDYNKKTIACLWSYHCKDITSHNRSRVKAGILLLKLRAIRTLMKEREFYCKHEKVDHNGDCVYCGHPVLPF